MVALTVSLSIFKLSCKGIRCPQLHGSANGTVRCDKLAFGVYCVPQCEKGLTRLLPDDIIRVPRDYACSLKGKWIPHDVVGDCSGMFVVYIELLRN